MSSRSRSKKLLLSIGNTIPEVEDKLGDYIKGLRVGGMYSSYFTSIDILPLGGGHTAPTRSHGMMANKICWDTMMANALGTDIDDYDKVLTHKHEPSVREAKLKLLYDHVIPDYILINDRLYLIKNPGKSLSEVLDIFLHVVYNVIEVRDLAIAFELDELYEDQVVFTTVTSLE